MTKPSKGIVDHLNPEQRQAVEHGVTGLGANIAGPVAVIAGAGSGKTKVLAERIANLVGHGVEPSRSCVPRRRRTVAKCAPSSST